MPLSFRDPKLGSSQPRKKSICVSTFQTLRTYLVFSIDSLEHLLYFYVVVLLVAEEFCENMQEANVAIITLMLSILFVEVIWPQELLFGTG